nr:G protein-coupled receptor [Proales similis]
MFAFELNGVVSSMISINTIGFQNVKWRNGSQVDLDARINLVSIRGYNYDLTLDKFPYLVFKKTRRFDLSGVVANMDRQVFALLPVDTVAIFVLNARKFLHNNPALFLDALDIDSAEPFKVALKSFYVVRNDRAEDSDRPKTYSDAYELELNKILLFEDEDFCIFSTYRNTKRKIRFLSKLRYEGRNITNIDFTIKRYGCTCTLLMMTIWNMTEGCDTSNQTFIESCQFEKRFRACENKTIESVHETDAYELVHSFQMLKLISTVAIGPIVSLLSIVLNGITLKVFRMMHDSPEYRANKQKAANDKMWEYLRHNCALNLLQSIIFLFIPLTTCVEFNGIYCSPFILDRPVQWFFLLVQTYAGNVLKLMSSVTYSAFVMYRLAFNTDRWKRFRSMKPARVMVGTLIFSAVWSVPLLFENGRYGTELLSKTTFFYLEVARDGGQTKSVFLNVAFLLNKALINVLLPTLNTIFDIWLLRFIKQKSKERKKESSEKKVTKMIVIGGLFSLFFRLPEFVVTIIRILFNIDPLISPLCVLSISPQHSMCQSLFESSLTFYSIVFLENFFLLYLFNQSFRTSFEGWIRIRKRST